MGNRTFCLDHGYVELIDSMGNDLSVANGARQSFDEMSVMHHNNCSATKDGKAKCDCFTVNGGASSTATRDTLAVKDAGLLNFLMRQRHTTPFELVTAKFAVQLPIFVAREWMRHRTQCLSGSAVISFDLPAGVKSGGFRHYELTMDELWRRWQPTVARSRPDRQGNAFRKRDRIKGMMLRCVDEATGRITHTRIVDVINSGEKAVYDATFSNGRSIRCTLDHRFWTDAGWMTLGEASKQPVLFATNGRWNPEGSTLTSTKYILLTQQQGHPLACKNGGLLAHRKIAFDASLDPICSICEAELVWGGENHVSRVTVDHIDRDKMNNKISNLRVLCTSCNTGIAAREDKKKGELFVDWSELLSLEAAGTEPTYDLSVEGPWHNFIADGSVVHNSFNEMSARYTQLPRLFYVPSRDNIREQKGKPGAYYYERISDDGVAEAARFNIECHCNNAFDCYETMMGTGVAKEVARLVLPVNTYTKMVVSANLLNWMRFLSLRNHEHAQWEIQQYAVAIEEQLTAIAPVAMEAFVKHGRLGQP